MTALIRAFGKDETGTVPVEWALLATLLVLGAITGAAAVRQATLAEADRAAAVWRDPGR